MDQQQVAGREPQDQGEQSVQNPDGSSYLSRTVSGRDAMGISGELADELLRRCQIGEQLGEKASGEDSSSIPIYFCGERHNTEASTSGSAEPGSEKGLVSKWRMKDRTKTVSVALVLCLNIGVDPPDVVKVSPMAPTECWIDPLSMQPQKALEAIGKTLQMQYERWQPRARYKVSLDPTVDDVKKLCLSCRRNAKGERVLFHYNGHGVPRPTVNGEVWVFNKSFTQYIPLSLYDLQTWLSTPSIYVFDCSAAGVIINAFMQFAEQRQRQELAAAQAGMPGGMGGASSSEAGAGGAGEEGAGGGFNSARSAASECILLAACAAHELLPQTPDLPADVFTSCLTTPIKIALRWFCSRSLLKNEGISLELIDRIPGRQNDRKTPLGELNWIFTAITDTIAWNMLPRPLFQRLFRQDLLVASLFRNFLLAERILRANHCSPMSVPRLPPTHQHPMWQAWDMAAEMCLSQLPLLLAEPTADFQPSPFFTEQLTAFEVWLEQGSERKQPPEQLPIVLQVLLSQQHRLRALVLLGRFLDMGPWAVDLALSVGIFPYVLKLLQTSAADLRHILVFIWTKILALDRSCQVDLVKDGGHMYFVKFLDTEAIAGDQRAMALFVLASIADQNPRGQGVCMQANLLRICVAHLMPDLARAGIPMQPLGGPDTAPGGPALPASRSPLLIRWLLLCLGKLWDNAPDVQAQAMHENVVPVIACFLTWPVPEVRAAAVYALGALVHPPPATAPPPAADSPSSWEQVQLRQADERVIGCHLLDQTSDASSLVRFEVTLALAMVAASHSMLFRDAVITWHRHLVHCAFSTANHPQPHSNSSSPSGSYTSQSSMPTHNTRSSTPTGTSPMGSSPTHQRSASFSSFTGLPSSSASAAHFPAAPSLRASTQPPLPTYHEHPTASSAAENGTSEPSISGVSGVLDRSGEVSSATPSGSGGAALPGEPDAAGLKEPGEAGLHLPGVYALTPTGPYQPALRTFAPSGVYLQRVPAPESGEVYASPDAARIGGGLYTHLLEALLNFVVDPSPRVAAAACSALQVAGVGPQQLRQLMSIPGVAPAGAPGAGNSAGTSPVESPVRGPHLSRVNSSPVARFRPGSFTSPAPGPSKPSHAHSNSDIPNLAEGPPLSHDRPNRGSSRNSSHESLPSVGEGHSAGEAISEGAGHLMPPSSIYSWSCLHFSSPLLEPQQPGLAPGGTSHGELYVSRHPSAALASGSVLYSGFAEEELRWAWEGQGAEGEAAGLGAPAATGPRLTVSPEVQEWRARNLAHAQANCLSTPPAERVSELVSTVELEGGHIPGALKMHPLQPLMFIGDERGAVNVWNWQKGSMVNRLEHVQDAHTAAATAATPLGGVTYLEAINPCEANLLLVGAGDGTVRVWRNYGEREAQKLAGAWKAMPCGAPAPRAPRQRRSSKVAPHLTGTFAVHCWQQESGYLFCAGEESPAPLLRIWDARKELCIHAIPSQHPAAVTSIGCDGAGMVKVVTGNADGWLSMFDTRAQHAAVGVHRSHPARILATRLQPGGHASTLLSASTSGDIKWFDVRKGLETPFRQVNAHKGVLSCLAAHPLQPLIAAGSMTQCVEVFNLDGVQLSALKYQSSFLGHRIAPVSCIDFHPNQPLLATGCIDSAVSVYKGGKADT